MVDKVEHKHTYSSKKDSVKLKSRKHASKGNSYYLPVAISKTNSGMIDNDFIMENKNKFFPNAFSFTYANSKNSHNLMARYGNRSIYLKKGVECTSINGEKIIHPRYTHFRIQNIESDVNSPFQTP